MGMVGEAMVNVVRPFVGKVDVGSEDMGTADILYCPTTPCTNGGNISLLLRFVHLIGNVFHN